MIKLKGGEESFAQSTMKKAMGMGAQRSSNTYETRHPGVNQQGRTESNNSSCCPPSAGGNQVARNLGMPSALPSAKKGKNWAADSNRINLGAPVYIKSVTSDSKADPEASKSDDDSDLDDLDDDAAAVASFRAARLAELQKNTSRLVEFRSLGHGAYNEIVQDDFLKEVTKSKYVICHFYHPNFERCKIVDKHLAILATLHLPTKFIKINAEKSPFFVGKLQVKILPTIIFFKDGIAVDRIVGFEEMGARDDFTTQQLEKRIAKSGFLIQGEDDEQQDKKATQHITNIRKSERNNVAHDDDDDDDEDDD